MVPERATSGPRLALAPAITTGRRYGPDPVGAAAFRLARAMPPHRAMDFRYLEDVLAGGQALMAEPPPSGDGPVPFFHLKGRLEDAPTAEYLALVMPTNSEEHMKEDGLAPIPSITHATLEGWLDTATPRLGTTRAALAESFPELFGLIEEAAHQHNSLDAGANSHG